MLTLLWILLVLNLMCLGLNVLIGINVVKILEIAESERNGPPIFTGNIDRPNANLVEVDTSQIPYDLE